MDIRRCTLEIMVIKKVLVTGHNGYIGMVLTELLTSQGFEVIGWDTDFYVSTAFNLPSKQINGEKLDVRNISQASLQGVDAIIHLAALSNDPMGDLNPSLTEQINYQATVRLAQMAKASGVKRFIFSSSCSIYGIASSGIVTETSPVNPLTSYATSKIRCEQDLIKLHDASFCVCLLRNSTVYGFSPAFRDDLVVNNLTACGMTTNEIRILSDGSPWRPLIDVRDLAFIMSLFLHADIETVNGEVINIGFNTSNYQVKELAQAVAEVLPGCAVIITGEHGADSRSYKVNFDKFNHIFPNSTPQWPLLRSIADLVKQLKTHKYTKQDFETKKFARITQLKKLLSEHKINDELLWQN